MSTHGSKICKVIMQGGPDVLARTGSMIAYEGLIDFNPNPPQLGQMARSWATGEGVPLMIATGQGDAVPRRLRQGGHRHAAARTRRCRSTARTSWPSTRRCSGTSSGCKGVSMLSGMGMFNVVIRGQGWVALTSKGTPIVLDTREAETFVDTDALVAFTEGLRIKPQRTARLGGLIGRGSGEAFQLGFPGRASSWCSRARTSGPTFSVRG